MKKLKVLWERIKNHCFHDWYSGCFQTGMLSEYTGDHIGRSERQCLWCPARQLRISQYSKEHQKIIRDTLGESKSGYYTYVPGDWLDDITKEWLGVHAQQKKVTLCQEN